MPSWPERILANISWRTKILGLSGTLLILCLSVGGVGAYFLYEQGNTVRTTLKGARHSTNVATGIRIAILELDRALQGLIAAENKAQIRRNAVASIRASSVLEEQITVLKDAFPDRPETNSLVDLLAAIKPAKMSIIKHARRNEDTEALQALENIQDQSARIEALSTEVFTTQQSELDERFEEVFARSLTVIETMAGICAFALFVGILLSLLAARLITRPLLRVNSGMSRLEHGDLTVELPRGGRDEIGCTVEAIRGTIDGLRRDVRSIQASNEQINASSSTISAGSKRFKEISELVGASADYLFDDAKKVNSAARQAAERITVVTDKARLTAESVSETVETITDISENFRQFQSRLENTAAHTSELADVAQNITTISSTIGSISDKTNLLALNAAIEAARAGEYGRGFAVVADEVRTLASNTRDAVAEITSLAELISQSVEITSKALRQVTDEAIKNIAQLQGVAENTAANGEITTNMLDLSNATMTLMTTQEHAEERIAASVRALVHLTDESKELADAFINSSDSLGTEVNALTRSVNRFKLPCDDEEVWEPDPTSDVEQPPEPNADFVPLPAKQV